MSKAEEITIVVSGSKKFKQEVIDKVYELLMGEEPIENAKPGDKVELQSSIDPSDEVKE